jgi:hypothetical protein
VSASGGSIHVRYVEKRNISSKEKAFKRVW